MELYAGIEVHSNNSVEDYKAVLTEAANGGRSRSAVNRPGDRVQTDEVRLAIHGSWSAE